MTIEPAVQEESLSTDLVSAKAKDAELIPQATDVAGKIWIVSVTILVLLYPIVFAFMYPLVQRELEASWQGVSFSISGVPVSLGLQQACFAICGIAILVINAVIAIGLAFHLKDVSADVGKGVGEIRGFAVGRGDDARRTISEALASFEHLLSWRYLFRYIGVVTLILYLALAGFWILVAIGVLQLPEHLAPATKLALFVLFYYLIAFGIRRMLRQMTRGSLESQVD